MSPLEKMRARLDELRAKSQSLYSERGALIDTAVSEGRSLTDAENAKRVEITEARTAVDAEIPLVTERITELEADEKRDQADAARRAAGTPTVAATGSATVVDPPVYAPDGSGHSYFRDLYASSVNQDVDAHARLVRAAKQSDGEKRALGNTGAAGGSGGELAPPLWLVSDFVALARPARVAANLVNNVPLPSGVSSINVPKISGGTTTAVQTTQNSTISQTDLTTTSVAANITTIAGKQLVSQQLLDQSAIPFDQVILQDLAADYAKQLDIQFLTGSGSSGQLRGLANGASVGGTTYTQASPTVGGAGQFYALIAKAISTVNGARFLPPTHIVMHPRRWGWVSASFDTANRPLLPMGTPSFNAVGDDNGGVQAQGYVGTMQGLPVFVDANIAINTGAGTNQDTVYVLRAPDVYLWESALRMESFRETYADSAGVLFRALGYSALIPDRYGPSVNLITGTGLVTPTF